MSAYRIPVRFKLSTDELASIVRRAAVIGIDASRVYAALGVRSAATGAPT